jgi:hypothetical protein
MREHDNQDLTLAAENDIAALYGLLKGFHEGSIWGKIPRSDADCIEYLSELVNDKGFVIINKDKNGDIVAALGVLFAAPWYNKSAKLALEIFWYKQPNIRLEAKEWILLAENICKIKGACAIEFSSVGLRRKALERLYHRAGYVEAERYYLRWL